MNADPRRSIGRREARVTELARLARRRAGLATPVPACPGWTRPRPAVSPGRACPADVNAGRIEGAGTDPWTRRSSPRTATSTRDELLEEWEREAPAFEEIIPMIQPPRPVYDIVVHEQDMRGRGRRARVRGTARACAWLDGHRAGTPRVRDRRSRAFRRSRSRWRTRAFVAGIGRRRRPVGHRAVRAVPLGRGRRSAEPAPRRRAARSSTCSWCHSSRWRRPTSSSSCERRPERAGDRPTGGSLYRALTCRRRSASRRWSSGRRDVGALDEVAFLIAAHAHPAARRRPRSSPGSTTSPTRCATRTRDGVSPTSFGAEGFHGNEDDYYDPENSFLDTVLDRRTGIPITLSVLLIEVARRVGVPLVGRRRARSLHRPRRGRRHLRRPVQRGADPRRRRPSPALRHRPPRAGGTEGDRAPDARQPEGDLRRSRAMPTPSAG